MQALICRGAGRVELVADWPEPVLPLDWARVRVRRAGVCATDLELAHGYKGFAGVLGHEFVGVVEACPTAPAWEGQRVVGEINVACGGCPTCHRGDRTHCARRRVLGILDLDGAFATHLALPVENLHAVPDQVPDADAVFVEPLAAALEILEQVHIRPSDRAIVLGDGKLGLLVAQVLQRTLCAVTLVGRHATKLELAAQWGIPTLQVAAGAALPPDLAGADLVVECTGHASGFATALALVRPRGTLVLKSTYHGAASVIPSDVVVNEITLIGSRCGPFAPALRLLAAGQIQVAPLLTATYPLSELGEAFVQAGMQGMLKVQVVCSEF